MPGQVRQSRHSLRLQDYDYSAPGGYFLTLVAHRHRRLFGQVAGGQVELSAAGRIVQEVWLRLPERYPQIETREMVVMPDHVHAIVIIHNPPVPAVPTIPVVPGVHKPPERPPEQTPEQPLGQQDRRRMLIPLLVGYWKMNSAKEINQLRGTPGVPVWRRDYYEHVIRGQAEYERIAWYIL